MAKRTSMPAKIYVAIDKDNNGNEYLTAEKTLRGVAADEARLVGVYGLLNVVTVWKDVRTK